MHLSILEPIYNCISKEIDMSYKAKIDKSYIYSEYTDFEYETEIFKYQINRACLKKEFYVIKFMLSKVQDYEMLQNSYRYYIRWSLEVLHRFGQFDMCKSILEEYMKSYPIKHLYFPTYERASFLEENIQYHFLVCIYHLQIDKKEAIKHLDFLRANKDRINRLSLEQKMIGYTNSFIYNYVFNTHLDNMTISYRNKLYLIPLDTHLDYISYLIKNGEFHKVNDSNQKILEKLAKIYPSTIYIVNYISKFILNTKDKLTLVPQNIHGKHINPIILKLFKGKIDFVLDHLNPEHKLALGM